MATCGRSVDGDLYCLGVHPLTLVPHSIPTIVESPTRWRDIALTQDAVCGHGDDAHVYCLGLFRGTEAEFREVMLPEPVSDISGGGNHFCAVGESGAVYCWGMNCHGQLGAERTDVCFGAADVYVETPVAFRGAAPFRAVSCGTTHTCALDVVGQVFCWGGNQSAQLGNGGADEGRASGADLGVGCPGVHADLGGQHGHVRAR